MSGNDLDVGNMQRTRGTLYLKRVFLSFTLIFTHPVEARVSETTHKRKMNLKEDIDYHLRCTHKSTSCYLKDFNLEFTLTIA